MPLAVFILAAFSYSLYIMTHILSMFDVYYHSSLFILLLCCLSLNFSAIQLSNIDLHKSQSWRIAKWKTYHGRSWSCWGSLVGRLFGVWKPCWILSTQYLYMFIAGKICFVRTMRRKGTECWGECLHVLLKIFLVLLKVSHPTGCAGHRGCTSALFPLRTWATERRQWQNWW